MTSKPKLLFAAVCEYPDGPWHVETTHHTREKAEASALKLNRRINKINKGSPPCKYVVYRWVGGNDEWIRDGEGQA